MREFGVDAFATDSWKSGLDSLAFCVSRGEVDVITVDGGGAGVTTSSRHWFDDDAGVRLVRECIPVGVSNVCGVRFGIGGIDWKACIGRASKNSWAMINGVLAGPGYMSIQSSHCEIVLILPAGTKRMSSHQVTGTFKCLLTLS